MHIKVSERFISFSAFCSLIAVVVFVVDPVTCSETQDGPPEYLLRLEGGGPPRALPKPSKGGTRLTKREAYRLQGHIQCSEVSVEGGTNEGGTTPVREVKRDSYKFLLKPKEDFQRIVFRMLIDNAFDVQPPYIYGNYLAITREMLEGDESEWREFQVKYYKHVVSMGRDKLALQVTVGNKTRPLITRRWWRTHAYSGFQISVEGGADFLFDCAAHKLIQNADEVIQNAPVSEAGQPLLLWGVLGSCFVLFLAGWVLYLAFRRRRSQNYEQAPPVPDLPKSLLLGTDKVNHSPDASQHIYDEFDEDTLSRLRQKLNATTLGNAVDGSSSKKPPSQQTAVENEYDIPKSVALRTRPREEENSPSPSSSSSSALLVRQQERVYMNEGALSLVEEKIKATSGIRDSMPETHYIEMNGIVNRSSVDMGKSQGQ